MMRVRTTMTGLQGGPYLSTMYFKAAVEDVAAAQDAVNLVGAFWGAIDNSLPNTLTWTTEAEVAVLTESGVQTGALNTTPATGIGSIAATLHSPAVQGLVRWTTSVFVGGRRVRGRTFIPGISNSVSTGSGVPTTAFATAVNAAATTLALAATNAFLVVWSRQNNTAAGVDGGSLWSQFAILRSRRDG